MLIKQSARKGNYSSVGTAVSIPFFSENSLPGSSSITYFGKPLLRNLPVRRDGIQ